jgi:catechol 2,3-dioxygenase-like lactoylglutathione lyase family enzyme
MERNETSTGGLTKFGGVTPILRVTNVQASVHYYTRALGFKVDFFEIIAPVSRDRCSLFLVPGDQGHLGGWVWIGVNDLDAVHEEYRQSGAIIRQPPTNFSWACEMQVEDPDGNVLRLGSDPKPNQQVGPWLDMEGRLWEMKADGSWTRNEP